MRLLMGIPSSEIAKVSTTSFLPTLHRVFETLEKHPHEHSYSFFLNETNWQRSRYVIVSGKTNVGTTINEQYRSFVLKECYNLCSEGDLSFCTILSCVGLAVALLFLFSWGSRSSFLSCLRRNQKSHFLYDSTPESLWRGDLHQQSMTHAPLKESEITCGGTENENSNMYLDSVFCSCTPDDQKQTVVKVPFGWPKPLKHCNSSKK